MSEEFRGTFIEQALISMVLDGEPSQALRALLHGCALDNNKSAYMGVIKHKLGQRYNKTQLSIDQIAAFTMGALPASRVPRALSVLESLGVINKFHVPHSRVSCIYEIVQEKVVELRSSILACHTHEIEALAVRPNAITQEKADRAASKIASKWVEICGAKFNTMPESVLAQRLITLILSGRVTLDVLADRLSNYLDAVSEGKAKPKTSQSYFSHCDWEIDYETGRVDISSRLRYLKRFSVSESSEEIATFTSAEARELATKILKLWRSQQRAPEPTESQDKVHRLIMKAMASGISPVKLYSSMENYMSFMASCPTGVTASKYMTIWTYFTDACWTVNWAKTQHITTTRTIKKSRRELDNERRY